MSERFYVVNPISKTSANRCAACGSELPCHSSCQEILDSEVFKGCLALDLSGQTWSSRASDLWYGGKRHVHSHCRDLSDLYLCDLSLILTCFSFSIFCSDELHVFDFPLLYKVTECAESEPLNICFVWYLWFGWYSLCKCVRAGFWIGVTSFWCFILSLLHFLC